VESKESMLSQRDLATLERKGQPSVSAAGAARFRHGLEEQVALALSSSVRGAEAPVSELTERQEQAEQQAAGSSG
jgi:hypothetical protein